MYFLHKYKDSLHEGKYKNMFTQTLEVIMGSMTLEKIDIEAAKYQKMQQVMKDVLMDT